MGSEKHSYEPWKENEDSSSFGLWQCFCAIKKGIGEEAVFRTGQLGGGVLKMKIKEARGVLSLWKEMFCLAIRVLTYEPCNWWRWAISRPFVRK